MSDFNPFAHLQLCSLPRVAAYIRWVGVRVRWVLVKFCRLYIAWIAPHPDLSRIVIQWCSMSVNRRSIHCCIAGNYGAKFAAPQLRFLLPSEIDAAVQADGMGLQLADH